MPPIHTPAAPLLALPAAVRKNLRIIHVSDQRAAADFKGIEMVCAGFDPSPKPSPTHQAELKPPCLTSSPSLTPTTKPSPNPNLNPNPHPRPRPNHHACAGAGACGLRAYHLHPRAALAVRALDQHPADAPLDRPLPLARGEGRPIGPSCHTASLATARLTMASLTMALLTMALLAMALLTTAGGGGHRFPPGGASAHLPRGRRHLYRRRPA